MGVIRDVTQKQVTKIGYMQLSKDERTVMLCCLPYSDLDQQPVLE